MKKTVWLLLALSLPLELLACLGCSFPAPWSLRIRPDLLPYAWGYLAIFAATPFALYYFGIRFKKVSRPSRVTAHCATVILIITELLSLGQSTLGGVVSGYLFLIPNMIILFCVALLEVWGLLLGAVIVYLLIYWIARDLSSYHVIRRGQTDDETGEALPQKSAMDQ